MYWSFCTTGWLLPIYSSRQEGIATKKISSEAFQHLIEERSGIGSCPLFWLCRHGWLELFCTPERNVKASIKR